MGEWIDDPERSGGYSNKSNRNLLSTKGHRLSDKKEYDHVASFFCPLCLRNFIICGRRARDKCLYSCNKDTEDSCEGFRAKARIIKCLWKLQCHQVQYNNSADVCIPFTVLKVILHHSICMRKTLFPFHKEYFYKKLSVIKNPTFLQQTSIRCLLYTRINARK